MVKPATEAMDDPGLLRLELTAKAKEFVLSAYQVRQLLRAGLYLSFGEYFRPESLREAYAAGQAFLETDDAPELSIQAVYQAASEALALDESTLHEQLYTSAKHLFPTLL